MAKLFVHDEEIPGSTEAKCSLRYRTPLRNSYGYHFVWNWFMKSGNDILGDYQVYARYE